MKTHKFAAYIYGDGIETLPLCTYLHSNKPAKCSFRWKDVDCKRCLRGKRWL